MHHIYFFNVENHKLVKSNVSLPKAYHDGSCVCSKDTVYFIGGIYDFTFPMNNYYSIDVKDLQNGKYIKFVEEESKDENNNSTEVSQKVLFAKTLFPA